MIAVRRNVEQMAVSGWLLGQPQPGVKLGRTCGRLPVPAFDPPGPGLFLAGGGSAHFLHHSALVVATEGDPHLPGVQRVGMLIRTLEVVCHRRARR